MSGVWVRVRGGLRRSWATLLAVSLLVGVAGGAVLWSVAASRRTGSAMDRFVAYNRPYDVGVAGLTPLQLHDLLRRPEVADWADARYMAMGYLAPGRPFDASQLGVVNPFGITGPHAFTGSNRPILVAGRLPDPAKADEVVVNELLVQRQHLHVGSRMTFGSFTQPTWDQYQGGAIPTPDGPKPTVRIVGIIRLPADVAFTSVDQPVIYLGAQDVYFDDAFVARYGSHIAVVGPFGDQSITVSLRARPGQTARLARVAHSMVDAHGGEVDVGSDAARAKVLSTHPVHLEATALLAFGALAAAAGLLLVGQAVSRQTLADTDDHRQLRELGMTRGQLYAISLARATTVGLLGALVAVGLAIGFSGLAPVGIARQAEIHPGVHLDVPVLALGGAAVLLVVLLLAVVPVQRAVASAVVARAEEVRPSRVAAGLARLGAPVSALLGVRLAFEGRRRTSAASRAALVAATTAIVAVTAASTFGASLHHLSSTPSLQGWTWDVVVGNANVPDARSRPAIAHLPTVGGYALTEPFDEPVQIGDQSVPGRAVQSMRGGVGPVVLDGRLPTGRDEIALGKSTLAALHRHVGDVVTVRSSAAHASMRIVGEAVMVPLADTDGTTLGKGAIVSPAGADALAVAGHDALEILVRFKPGVSHAAGVRSLQPVFSGTVLEPVAPQDVADVTRLDRLPEILAGLVVLVAVGTLLHALVLSVRARRRELGVLRTIGLTPRQVVAAIAAQAAAVALVAVAVGIPLGVAGGRLGWRLVNDGIGSLASPAVPLATVVLCAVIGLVGAQAIAVLPGWISARGRPSEALRAE